MKKTSAYKRLYPETNQGGCEGRDLEPYIYSLSWSLGTPTSFTAPALDGGGGTVFDEVSYLGTDFHAWNYYNRTELPWQEFV